MYEANQDRYKNARYRRCGASGLQLPSIALGLWHNFGVNDDFETMREILFCAFDNGITYFDLANNYGPYPGRAEENFGAIMKNDLRPYRDELIVATKAGYTMWAGPYGDWGSRKYLLASLDQSLKRMNLEYADIFYSHRMDPNTPLEETIGALNQAVCSGKAIYAGISNYDAQSARKARSIADGLGLPLIVNQVRYSILDRHIESDALQAQCKELGMGIAAFSPLAQGILTDRYLSNVPSDSRIRKDGGFLKEEMLTRKKMDAVRLLNETAIRRGQTLAQLALQWVLKSNAVTCALIGASKPCQVTDALGACNASALSAEELWTIDDITREIALF